MPPAANAQLFGDTVVLKFPEGVEFAVVNPNGCRFVSGVKTRCVRMPLPERRAFQNKETL